MPLSIILNESDLAQELDDLGKGPQKSFRLGLEETKGRPKEITMLIDKSFDSMKEPEAESKHHFVWKGDSESYNFEYGPYVVNTDDIVRQLLEDQIKEIRIIDLGSQHNRLSRTINQQGEGNNIICLAFSANDEHATKEELERGLYLSGNAEYLWAHPKMSDLRFHFMFLHKIVMHYKEPLGGLIQAYHFLEDGGILFTDEFNLYLFNDKSLEQYLENEGYKVFLQEDGSKIKSLIIQKTPDKPELIFPAAYRVLDDKVIYLPSFQLLQRESNLVSPETRVMHSIYYRSLSLFKEEKYTNADTFEQEKMLKSFINQFTQVERENCIKAIELLSFHSSPFKACFSKIKNSCYKSPLMYAFDAIGCDLHLLTQKLDDSDIDSEAYYLYLEGESLKYVGKSAGELVRGEIVSEEIGAHPAKESLAWFINAIKNLDWGPEPLIPFDALQNIALTISKGNTRELFYNLDIKWKILIIIAAAFHDEYLEKQATKLKNMGLPFKLNSEANYKAKNKLVLSSPSLPLYTALDYCTEDYLAKEIQQLLSHGNIPAYGKDGWYPVFKRVIRNQEHAAIEVFLDYIKQLVDVEKAANFNFEEKDSDGRTLIFDAIETKNLKLVSELINLDADIAAIDNMGFQPLHYAAKKGFTEIVAVLLQANADINAKDNNGHTPLALATAKGKKSVIDLLTQEQEERTKITSSYSTTALIMNTSIWSEPAAVAVAVTPSLPDDDDDDVVDNKKDEEISFQ